MTISIENIIIFNLFIKCAMQIKILRDCNPNCSNLHSPIDEWDLPKEPRHDGPVVQAGVHRGEVEADADAEGADHNEEAAPMLTPKLHS